MRSASTGAYGMHAMQLTSTQPRIGRLMGTYGVPITLRLLMLEKFSSVHIWSASTGAYGMLTLHLTSTQPRIGWLMSTYGVPITLRLLMLEK